MSDSQHIPAPLEGRTIRQPAIGPFHDICSGADVSFPKPGELIEIHGHANLTMQDRRTLNLLIVNAWPQITEDIEHRIHKAHLTGTHESTDDTGGEFPRPYHLAFKVTDLMAFQMHKSRLERSWSPH